MNRTTVKVSKRYQIAVPAMARDLLKIESGDRLLVDVQNGVMILVPLPENYTEAMAGLDEEIWADRLVEEYLAGERTAWPDSLNT